MSFGKDPMLGRKGDNNKNGDNVHGCQAKQREREKGMYPLRITPKTVIYVSRDKLTAEYAKRYRKEKLGIK